MSSAPEALTLDEFCKRVKMGRTKAYEEVRAGRLVVRKNGKKSIVTVVDGQRYLESCLILSSRRSEGLTIEHKNSPQGWVSQRRKQLNH